jgi:NAD(P)-dependent dehydrogenase (short-subunit alcohol dehydrogenase family)
MSDPRPSDREPPFPGQDQEPPGSDEEMQPKADHGEESYRGLGRLKHRVAVITGGDSGIGRAVALAYAREGADVLISYLNEHEDAAITAGLVGDAGRRAVTMAGDIGDPAHCADIVQRAVDDLGTIDILVNNAAHQMARSHVTEIPTDEVEVVFRTNVLSMFYLCKEALPYMGPGSTIINTASVQAFDPSPPLLHYAATKAAIVNFSQNLAQQLTGDGIRVNAVAPGPVWTPLIPISFDEEKVRQFGADSPMGRPAQPAELAPVYVFLASDESRYLSGQVVGVTGGRPVP